MPEITSRPRSFVKAPDGAYEFGGDILLSGEARGYFTRKHAWDELGRLQRQQGRARPVLVSRDDEGGIDAMAEVADRIGLVPVVAFLPREDAFAVFDGKAALAKVEVADDDGGDDAPAHAQCAGEDRD